MKNYWILIFCLTIGINTYSQVKLEVDATQQGIEMSQDLIGAFFEDINYAADGGLYAELIQNRSFEYYPVSGYTSMQPFDAWSLIKGTGNATYTVENKKPINEVNTNYLKLSISNPGDGIKIKNSGFNGILVEADSKYDFSVYMRRESNFDEDIIIQIEKTTGSIICSDTIKGISSEWVKYKLVLTSDQTNAHAKLSIRTKVIGNVYFDMVSLFPQHTFKNRKNGLRNDLATAVADLEPKFLRFPGGCISHGRGIDNAYRWKETIGDVAERTPNWNLWGYHQTYGLGFFEYFQFSEDLGAKPLPVIPVGISCQFRNREIVPMNEMQPWVDDAIDLIEFANGTITSEWGAIRAEMGHPEPFNLEYLCLGNEEDDMPEFRQRFTLIADALRKQYPEIKIIGTSGTAAAGNNYNSLWDYSRKEKLDAVDEHYYMDPSWFINNNHRYDNFDRSGPKVFIGEYASKDDKLSNAIAEAAYLTGVERNSDIIQFTCYAPLFCNESNNQWHPDLIRFTNDKVVKTASYYVQQLYSTNAGDEYLESAISYDNGFNISDASFAGKIGVGTWNTQAQFDNIKVLVNNEVFVEENFDSGTSSWNVSSGTFNLNDGAYTQSSNNQPALSIFNTAIDKSEYTVTINAKKTGGTEGFLIPFGYLNSNNYYWFNIGGWNNTQHAIEQVTNGSKSTLYTIGGSIKNNVWYEIKMSFNKSEAKLYIDNKLIFTIPAPPGPLTASVTKDMDKNEMILKLTNTGSSAMNLTIDISGINLDGIAKVTTLSGSASQRNSISSPELIVPYDKSIEIKNQIEYTLPGNSFQVIRISMDNSSVGSNQKKLEKVINRIKIIPNPVSDHAEIIFENPMEGEFMLLLFNMQGRLALKKDGLNKNQLSFQKGDLSTGNYILELRNASESYSKKIVFI